jgi:hypothetical protein
LVVDKMLPSGLSWEQDDAIPSDWDDKPAKACPEHVFMRPIKRPAPRECVFQPGSTTPAQLAASPAWPATPGAPKACTPTT